MTNPFLTLEGVSYVLPDGRALFSGLDERFDQRRTGIVGRNGSGKTVLAHILAGRLPPAAGRSVRSGSVHYLAQQVSPEATVTVADLAGVRDALDALGRIEGGSVASSDFEAVAERWDLRARFQRELERNGLGHLDAEVPADAISGGEAMRVALAGALLSDAAFLILDEPSNHLDRRSRDLLVEQLRRWPRGLLVISHDRQLLQAMERIVELSSLGLRSYGGDYGFYAQCKELERESAVEQLERSKLERRREERDLREQRERQDRRQAEGRRLGHEANQARILLGLRKNRSDATAGKLRRQHAATRERTAVRVLEAARRVEESADVSLHALPVDGAAQRRVAELTDVELPFAMAAMRRISLRLGGKQRVGVVGPNGCGKSTLLKVLAGRLRPLAGACTVAVESAHLDQQLAMLDPSLSLLEQLRAANPVAAEADLRMRLVHLGLDTGKLAVPCGGLSGGERLKAALACVLYAQTPAQLLLLDEPANHLDLPSIQALETMLCGYQGALVVVSHDEVLLDRLGLTDRLAATAQGWRMERW
jgi:ATPase subunit of ABC transporter with duplicated ATPase domains